MPNFFHFIKEEISKYLEEQNLRGVDGVGDAFDEARFRAIMSRTTPELKKIDKGMGVHRANTSDKWYQIVTGDKKVVYTIEFDAHSSTACFVTLEKENDKIGTLKFISNESNSQIAYQIVDAIKNPDKVQGVEKPEKSQTKQQAAPQAQEEWKRVTYLRIREGAGAGDLYPITFEDLKKAFGVPDKNHVGLPTFQFESKNSETIRVTADDALWIIEPQGNYSANHKIGLSFLKWLRNKLAGKP